MHTTINSRWVQSLVPRSPRPPSSWMRPEVAKQQQYQQVPPRIKNLRESTTNKSSTSNTPTRSTEVSPILQKYVVSVMVGYVQSGDPNHARFLRRPQNTAMRVTCSAHDATTPPGQKFHPLRKQTCPLEKKQKTARLRFSLEKEIEKEYFSVTLGRRSLAQKNTLRNDTTRHTAIRQER